MFGCQALGVWRPSIGCLVAKDRVFGGYKDRFCGQGLGLVAKDRIGSHEFARSRKFSFYFIIKKRKKP